VIAAFLCVFVLCAPPAGEQGNGALKYRSFRDVPGVTEDEIRAVLELQKRKVPFLYGTMPSTEIFVNANGEMQGFTVLLCEWLSWLFEIPFTTGLYTWGDMLAGLETREIDFTGELTATPERRKTYIMTDAIAERLVKYFRITGSPPLDWIAQTRPLRFGFLSGTTTINEVSEKFDGRFESLFVDSYEDAYRMLKNGTMDAFFEESTAEAAFDIYRDVVVEDFFPLIYGPVSITTQNPENMPIISIVQKVIQNGGIPYLAKMYSHGMQEYKKHKLSLLLTDEEQKYIRDHTAVQFLAEHDNYPLSFYNSYDREFQGICHDVLKEIELLTGLCFELANDQSVDWMALYTQLEAGEASMVSELIRTPERVGRFLWPKNVILTDYYALLSKTSYPNITINEILHTRVGLVKGYAQTELFNRWFPDHRDTVMYDNFHLAFAALERDDVDVVMGTHSQLLMQANFYEKPGYKTNIVFDYSYESAFGFNKKEAVLCSIMDKALNMIDIKSIASQWTLRTYDYSAKLTRSRLPWLLGAVVMLVCVLILLFVLFQRNRRETKKLIKFQNVVMETMAELVEYRDDATGDHIGRTSKFLKILIDALLARGLYRDQTASWNIDQMILSAQLHDVGKIAIDDSILRKPGKLTEEEFSIIKKHTILGGEIIEHIRKKTSEKDFLYYAGLFALYHHEKWDGSGYPFGISGENIPLMARLMAIVDVYDALISERPYKKPTSHTEAIKIIQEGSGSHFDPALAELFISVADRLSGTMKQTEK
jgi:HD-GYP domain-containing protein (c-di-GMP phosphodiesterase class II)